jgi:hypothetical protein
MTHRVLGECATLTAAHHMSIPFNSDLDRRHGCLSPPHPPLTPATAPAPPTARSLPAAEAVGGRPPHVHPLRL